jgi:hypothetical protein
MVAYNRFHEYIGSLSQIAGLGTIVYGLAIQDMETIAGGFAMGYVGRCMTKDCWDIQHVQNEMKRNEILKKKQSLEDKLPE